MEGYLRKEEKCKNRDGVFEEKKLELRLGPPDGDWSSMKDSSKVRRVRDDSNLSLGNFCSGGAKLGFLDHVNGVQAHKLSSFLHHHVSGVAINLKASEKNAFSPPPTAAAKATSTDVANTSQKRTAPSPVVGWPPLRSFRKNLTSSSPLKPNSESQNAEVSNKFSSEKTMENSSSQQKGFFVKINMDGIPIGRKVDLSAYDSYEKLASAVNELFRGLLAAQNKDSRGGNHDKEEGEKAITGLLDGNEQYTLVYEDNEGDTMLVGDDVHWQMFVSTVKRLRVLKSSELSSVQRGKQVKL